jgi:hypothetical protein
MKLFHLLTAVTLAAALSPALLAEDVIYANNTVDTGFTQVFDANAYIAVGNQITFAGTSRFLTQASFEMFNASPNLDTLSAATLSLYNVSGSVLGSLIGSFTLAPANYVASQIATLTFNLPWVVVPNEIVWAISFSDSSNLGLNIYTPATVGTNLANTIWRDTGSGLSALTVPANSEEYNAQFLAVAETPEPSTWVLLGAGLATLAWRRRGNLAA